mmetsp:Transcript_45493/g.128066  ORF Transcript_45493/g.128066 Transcript_45493/m.128066 type:complete len:287 (+) Transcript_45493:900-1760(+)
MFRRHLDHRAELHAGRQRGGDRVGGAGEELVLEVLQGLQRRIQDVPSVLLQNVQPLEDMSVDIVEGRLGRLESGLRLQVTSVGRADVLLHNILEVLLRAVQLDEPSPPDVQADLEVAVVHDVILHRVQNVEVHVSAQLRNRAVRGVRAGDLVRSLLELTAVGGDQGVVRVRKAARDALGEGGHALGQGLDPSHEHLDLVVHAMHDLVERAEVAHHALKDGVHGLAVEPLLLHHGPFCPDAVDVVLQVVHGWAEPRSKPSAPPRRRSWSTTAKGAAFTARARRSGQV